MQTWHLPNPKTDIPIHRLARQSPRFSHPFPLLVSMAAAVTATSSLTVSSSLSKTKAPFYVAKPVNVSFHVSVSLPCKNRLNRTLRIVNSISVSDPGLRTGPDDLVSSILSKVRETDGGLSLTKEQHKEVAEVAQELRKYCVKEPVKCPLIFGDWDVAYCSRPTSPGGGYRSVFGRLFFKTKEMIQVVEEPDIVRNKVSFSALGFLDGEVSLKGKLKVMDSEWIQVIFEPPELKVGGMEFKYGFESEVKLQITYIDEKIRLGKGSKGSLFVFHRRP